MGKEGLNTYRHAINVMELRLSIREFSLLVNKSYRPSPQDYQKG